MTWIVPVFFFIFSYLLLTLFSSISIELLLYKFQHKRCRLIRFWRITDTNIVRHNLKQTEFIHSQKHSARILTYITDFMRPCPWSESAPHIAQSKMRWVKQEGLATWSMIWNACMQSCYSYAITTIAQTLKCELWIFIALLESYTISTVFWCSSHSLPSHTLVSYIIHLNILWFAYLPWLVEEEYFYDVPLH